MKSYQALATLLQAELDDIAHSVERAEHLLEKAEQRNDDDYFDGIALNLHGFYSGTERVFQEIARTVDGYLPSGREWHPELLMQMSVAMEGVRPAVIQRNTRLCLDDYRSFRHVVRNLYTFNLRPITYHRTCDRDASMFCKGT